MRRILVSETVNILSLLRSFITTINIPYKFDLIFNILQICMGKEKLEFVNFNIISHKYISSNINYGSCMLTVKFD